MIFTVLTDDQKQQYKNDMLEIMKICDADFVPPLSSRSSTTQSDLKAGEYDENGIAKYYTEMEKQQILAAIEDDGRLLGFVSYKEDYLSDIVTKTPNIYLSTLMLHPDARGKRLTNRMYEHLFCELYPDRSIFTRTWSTNAVHIKILSNFGISEFHRIKDDRGEGIDTVYFSNK